MRRTTLNFVVDLIGLTNLLLLMATGAIMRWVLPPGSSGGGAGHGYGFRGGRGPGLGGDPARRLLGLGRHDWGDIHFILASVFVLLIVVHLILHWAWIKTCAKSIFLPSRKIPCDRAGAPDA